MTLLKIKSYKHNYIIIFILLYTLSNIVSLLGNEYFVTTPLLPHNGLRILYYGFIIVIVCLFTNLFGNTKTNLVNQRELSIKKYSLNKIMVISFFSFIIAGRIIVFYIWRQKTGPIYLKEEILYDITRYILGGIAEELLFTGLLYGYLKQKRMKDFLTIAIVTVLFILPHFNFTLGAIISFTLFRVIVLIGFKFYPSLLFFSMYHILYNAVHCILQI